jgi:8-oxo-dGTP diphosphatase
MTAGPYCYEWPRPSVTVDVVVFGLSPSLATRSTLEVLLIERDRAPFAGAWAFPGGFIEPHEDLEFAARRELLEETGVSGLYIEQLYTFGRPGRDPRGHTVTVAYYALVSRAQHPAIGGSDARRAAWFPVRDVPTLAFDHADVLGMALGRLKSSLRYRPIGFQLLPDAFTLGELQALYEAVLERPIDKRNFRRKVDAMGILVDTGERRRGAHRSAALFRFDQARYTALDSGDFEL